MRIEDLFKKGDEIWENLNEEQGIKEFLKRMEKELLLETEDACRKMNEKAN